MRRQFVASVFVLKSYLLSDFCRLAALLPVPGVLCWRRFQRIILSSLECLDLRVLDSIVRLGNLALLIVLPLVHLCGFFRRSFWFVQLCFHLSVESHHNLFFPDVIL